MHCVYAYFVDGVNLNKATNLFLFCEINSIQSIVSQEWIEHNRNTWSAGYLKQTENYLNRDILPQIGAIPIRSLKAAYLLKLIRKVEERGAPSVAALIRLWIGQICRYAIVTLRIEITGVRVKSNLLPSALRV
ncbi:hypothetical protein VN23_04010 [Janthinobacterium sp. B9-8]|nr:hypothetical protein VN23_04010 [Janthinobacterium sp. B9-8]